MVGRPSFEPTLIERDLVAAMTAYGAEAEAICRLIRRPRGRSAELKPISPTTLRKYFRHELDSGLDQANAKVAETMYKRAIDLKHPQGAISGMFWLKARAGWKDRQTVEHTGKDGKPIEFALDLSDATAEELEVLERFLARKAEKLQPANDSAAA